MWFLFYKEMEVLEEKNCRTFFLPLLLIYITKSLLKILTPFHYLSTTSSHPVLRQCNTNNIFSYSLFVFRKSTNADFLSKACAFIQKHILKSKDNCNQENRILNVAPNQAFSLVRFAFIFPKFSATSIQYIYIITLSQRLAGYPRNKI